MRARFLTSMVGAAVFASAMMTSGAADAAERKLTFAVSGVVSSIEARSGASVKAGAILARLDGTVYAAKLKAAEAGVEAAVLAQELAAKSVEQAQQLFDDLSTSAEELDNALLRHVQAKANLAKANARFAKAKWRAERAVLRAPRSGTVVSVPGFAGMVIEPRAGLQTVIVLNSK